MTRASERRRRKEGMGERAANKKRIRSSLACKDTMQSSSPWGLRGVDPAASYSERSVRPPPSYSACANCRHVWPREPEIDEKAFSQECEVIRHDDFVSIMSKEEVGGAR